MKYNKQKYIRHSTTDTSILSLVTDKPKNRKNKVRVEINGEVVNLSSLRLLCFKEKGLECITCGIKGSFLALERGPKDSFYHLNLYAVDSDGDEILMTKDHRIPKCKDGPDHIDNMQTMCTICNGEKGGNL